MKLVFIKHLAFTLLVLFIGCNTETRHTDIEILKIDSVVALHLQTLDSALINGSFRYDDLSAPAFFFEELTGIPAHGDGQWTGWTYPSDTLLQKDIDNWSRWVEGNRSRLSWDSSKGVYVH